MKLVSYVLGWGLYLVGKATRAPYNHPPRWGDTPTSDADFS